MCIRRFVLYQCGHEGRQLGYSYCQFQEALDRLGDQSIPENHPIIKQHQKSCRMISRRQGELRHRDCGECSRAPKSNELGGIQVPDQLSGSGVTEVANENGSSLIAEDDECQVELPWLPPLGETHAEGLEDEMRVGEESMKGEKDQFRSFGDRWTRGMPDDGFRAPNCPCVEDPGSGSSFSDSGPYFSASYEPREPSPSNSSILEADSAKQETSQTLDLLSSEVSSIRLARRPSDSSCSTCSDPHTSKDRWSTGSELWNEEYQGERATAEVFERPVGESCRVVDIGAAGPGGVRGDCERGDKEGEETMDEKEEVEMADMTFEEQSECEREIADRSSLTPRIPQLRRKRKSLSLRKEV